MTSPNEDVVDMDEIAEKELEEATDVVVGEKSTSSEESSESKDDSTNTEDESPK